MAKKNRSKGRPPPRHKTSGQPPRLADKRVAETLLDYLRAGSSQRGACAKTGVSIQALMDHKNRDADFADRVDMARDHGKATLLDRVFGADHDWKSAAWLLERMYWKEFARRNPDKISPEQLAMVLGQFVTVVLPFVPTEKHEELQGKISQLLSTINLMGA